MENDKNKNQQQNVNSGSQVNPVSRFGNYSNTHEDANDIKSRISESRAKNISNSRASGNVSSSNHNPLSNNNTGSDSENKSKSNVNEKTSKSESSVGKSSKSLKSKVGSGLGSIGKGVLNKSLDKVSEDSDVARTAINAGRKTAGAVKGTVNLVNIVKKLAIFFTTPVGVVVGYIILAIISIIFVAVILNTIVSNLGMKFGLTSEETYEAFNECFEEGMSRSEIEDIMTMIEKGKLDPTTCKKMELDEEDTEMGFCKVSFFASIKHFFGIWDTTDPCELAHYIKHLIEQKEKRRGISSISPGYFVSALYYSFDTQNNNRDGEPFIKPKEYENTDEEGNTYIINDLDAITTLIDVGIYNNNDIETLLDNYMVHYIDDEETYPVYNWEWIYPTDTSPYQKWVFPSSGSPYREWVYPKDTAPYQDCVLHSLSDEYEIDELKFKLYLRYGQGIADKYEDDMNKVATYNQTSKECTRLLPYPKPGMSKYNKKADPNTEGNDNAKIDGVGYNSGFIYKTYPRYNPKYIIDNINYYDYITDKDIEHIVELIESRQDYSNYVLGYPNNVEVEVNHLGYLSTRKTCSYQYKGENLSNVKVRLLHARNNDAIPGAQSYAPIEEEELVDFDKYVLGVVYAEAGGSSEEVLKVQAVAAASYTLAGAINGRFNMIKEDGQTIIEISNSTFHQTYCDPDKGCQACFSSKYSQNGIVTLLSNGVNIPGSNCQPHFNGLESDSRIRTAVKEVAGKTLVDAQGEVVATGYEGVHIYPEWVRLADSGLDYVEILRSTYGKEYMVSQSNCTYSSNGEWASWRQKAEPWGSMMVYNKTFGSIGCFMTSYAMALAKSGQPLVVNDFNPGTFLTLIKRNNCLSGNSLYSDCAIRAALGEGVPFVNAGVDLTGKSYNDKVATIAKYMNMGYDIILRVRSNASMIYGGGNEHWVFVTGVEGNNIYMADPNSDETIVLNKYRNEGIVHFQYVKFG